MEVENIGFPMPNSSGKKTKKNANGDAHEAEDKNQKIIQRGCYMLKHAYVSP